MSYSSCGAARSNSSMVCSHSGSEMVTPLGSRLRLQIPVHEIDLLQPAKALADVLRPHVPHAVDGLQLAVGRCEDLVQPGELAHDRLDHELRKPRNAAQDPIAARRDRVVEGVELPVVAEKLREPAEVQ